MSDHKQGAVARRDARATKAEETSPGRGKKKDTKRWCRGRVGKEHTPKCMNYADVKRAYSGVARSLGDMCRAWRLLVCTTCGRELDFYIPRAKRGKPEWVTS